MWKKPVVKIIDKLLKWLDEESKTTDTTNFEHQRSSQISKSFVADQSKDPGYEPQIQLTVHYNEQITEKNQSWPPKNQMYS